MNSTTHRLLLPYQEALWRAAAAHRVVVVEKSRRVGVTWALAGLAALTAARSKAEGGMPVLAMAYNREAIGPFLAETQQWLELFAAAAGTEGPLARRTRTRLTLACSHTIDALPARPRALRGRQGLVILDEAAFMDELEATLEAALALLMWGGRVVVASTHKGRHNPFARLVADCRAGLRPFHLMTVDLDRALAEGLYRRICAVNGTAWSAADETAWREALIAEHGAAAEEELFARPAEPGGAFFDSGLLTRSADAEVPFGRFLAPEGAADPTVQQAMLEAWAAQTLWPALAAEPLPTGLHGLGIDVGRKQDATILWVQAAAAAAGAPSRTRLVAELRGVAFARQAALILGLVARLPRQTRLAVDATGSGAWLAEHLAEHLGAPRVAQIALSPAWYAEALPAWRRALEDGRARLPAEPDILLDHAMVTVEAGRARLPPGRRLTGSDGHARHGDSAIAAALAWSLLEAPPPPPLAFQAIARPRWSDGASALRI